MERLDDACMKNVLLQRSTASFVVRGRWVRKFTFYSKTKQAYDTFLDADKTDDLTGLKHIPTCKKKGTFIIRT